MTSFTHKYDFLFGEIEVICSLNKMFIYYTSFFETYYVGEFDHCIDLDQSKRALKQEVTNVSLYKFHESLINTSRSYNNEYTHNPTH